MTTPTCLPDLSARPHRLTLERQMRATADALYWAWTEQFDRWIAAPGTMMSAAEVDTAFYFEARPDGRREPHYGRFLRLEPGRRVELTWLSRGTGGLETLITIELTPNGYGTLLRLSQAGFADEAAMQAHEAAWPDVLARLDAQVAD